MRSGWDATADEAPLVSCIMPTADRRTHVERALGLFRAQLHPARELVIVDDGTDPVADLVAGEPGIQYLRLDEPTILGRKRNLAVAAARGSIIAHWDDDDWYGADRLGRQLAQLSRSGVSVCGLRSLLYLSLPGGHAWRYTYPRGLRPWVSGSTMCYLRRVWEEHPFAEVATGEDTRFVWAIDPESVEAAADDAAPWHDWHVGIMHGDNTAARDPAGPWWREVHPTQVRTRMGAATLDALLASATSEHLERRRSEQQPGREERTAPVQASGRLSRASSIAPPSGAGGPSGLMGPRLAGPSVEGLSGGRSGRAQVGAACVDVVVTCHAAYLHWLDAALDSIDAQTPAPGRRVLVLDGCQAPERPGWLIVRGGFGEPSSGRNAGLAGTDAPWVVFWDADNVMPAGYVAAVVHAATTVADDTGILYPDLAMCDAQMQDVSLRTMPEWDYWALRAENMIDTASAWRREALDLAGPWPSYVRHSHEDYALALDLTAAGWTARRLDGPAVLVRDHGRGRNRVSMSGGTAADDIWRARSLGIVTLLAPRRRAFRRWREFISTAELPPKTSLYVVDNSDGVHAEHLHEALKEFADRGIARVEVVDGGLPFAAGPGPAQGRDNEHRHRHVARLYAQVLPLVREDLVLTLEDDVVPPPDAVRRLGRAFDWAGGHRVGAVAAAYPWPGYRGLVCAGLGDAEWGEALAWSSMSNEPVDVGFVGGGCTMWANWALHGGPVRFHWDRRLGWDAGLCLRLRQDGYRVQLHGGVRCDHIHDDDI